VRTVRAVGGQPGLQQKLEAGARRFARVVRGGGCASATRSRSAAGQGLPRRGSPARTLSLTVLLAALAPRHRGARLVLPSRRFGRHGPTRAPDRKRGAHRHGAGESGRRVGRRTSAKRAAATSRPDAPRALRSSAGIPTLRCWIRPHHAVHSRAPIWSVDRRSRHAGPGHARFRVCRTPPCRPVPPQSRDLRAAVAPVRGATGTVVAVVTVEPAGVCRARRTAPASDDHQRDGGGGILSSPRWCFRWSVLDEAGPPAPPEPGRWASSPPRWRTDQPVAIIAARRSARKLEPGRSGWPTSWWKSDRLTQTVTRYLRFARGESRRRRKAERDSGAPGDARPARGEIEGRKVSLDRAGSPRRPGRARRESLKQVYLNLVLNALESMPEGGRLEVAVAERKGTVEDVADTGAGSRPSARQIARPFFTTRPRAWPRCSSHAGCWNRSAARLDERGRPGHAAGCFAAAGWLRSGCPTAFRLSWRFGSP
jgi:hypothetical protein